MVILKPEVTLDWDPIEDLVQDVVAKKKTAVSQIERAIAQIEKANDAYQAVISITKERALARAKEIDEQIKKGEKVGRLAGVPFIAKDNFLVYGADTTAASNMLKGFDPPYQSSAIELLEAEGAICVAKANLDAFAHGASTENSDFMITKNPYDKSRVAGGSSGGSAASVALGMAPFALGTDTGGSIRQPASFCGVVGYKPTYGLVSRSGVVAMASSTDTIGVLARNSADAALVMDVMAGKDPLDGTTIETPHSIMPVATSMKGKKIGIIKEYFENGLDSGVEKSVKEAIEVLKKAGAVIEEVSVPSISLALAVYYIIVPAELSSNLARHDGQRYQYSSPDAKDLNDSYELSRSNGFGDEAKRRIMIGAHVLSSGYYDAYYKKAQIVRTKLIDEFAAAFEKFDYLVGPVSPTPAFKIGENADDPVQMYLQDIMTVAANLVGNPAISIPCGMSDGLPVGLQLMSAQKTDKELFEIATIYEGLR